MPEPELASENERLRREVEDLRKQNHELNAELERLRHLEQAIVGEVAIRHLLA